MVKSMEEKNFKLLQEGLEILELKLSFDQLQRLKNYHDFLMEWNQKVNLSGHKEERQSIIFNILNALAPWKLFRSDKISCDVGSGGGLPGIPLAIALEMPKMTLVESKQKKCTFLQAAIQHFAPEVSLFCNDVRLLRTSFQQVISCAYGSLAKILESTRFCLGDQGSLLIYKGKKESIEKEIQACPRNQRAWKIKPFQIPMVEEEIARHLCIFQNKKSFKTSKARRT